MVRSGQGILRGQDGKFIAAHCFKCESCLRPDCGKCIVCKSKVAFGGRGKSKKICALRTCSLRGTPSKKTPAKEKQSQGIYGHKSASRSVKSTCKNEISPKAKVKVVNYFKKTNQSKNVTPKTKLSPSTEKHAKKKNDDAVIVQPKNLPRPLLKSITKLPAATKNVDKNKDKPVAVGGEGEKVHSKEKVQSQSAQKGSARKTSLPGTCTAKNTSVQARREETEQCPSKGFNVTKQNDTERPSQSLHAKVVQKSSGVMKMCKTSRDSGPGIEEPGNKEGDNSNCTTPMKVKEFPKGLFFPNIAEIYICYFCEKEFLVKEKMRQHQKLCPERPPQLQKYQFSACLPVDKPPHSPPTISPRYPEQKYPKEPVSSFIRHFGLIPKHTAAKLREHRPSLEIDCDIEELEAVPVITPVTPVTPCSPPISLMSQLSKEEPSLVSRKRLSYSMSVDKEKDKDNFVVEDLSDSYSSDSDEEETSLSGRKRTNLLNIPISSLLGQRVQKYMHVDTPVSVVKNSESFCQTPVKNTFIDKLRRKGPHYPHVYKPRRIANLHKQDHMYKFTKADVKEFMNKLATGLNYESRQKLKLLKKLRIGLTRLTTRQLLRWIPKYILNRQLHRIYSRKKSRADEEDSNHFPHGPTLLVPKIDSILGLKRRSSQDSKKALSLGHFVSEEMEAEMEKQKLILYRSLLYELSVLTPTVVVTDINSNNSQNVSKRIQGKKLPLLNTRSCKPEELLQNVKNNDQTQRLKEQKKTVVTQQQTAGNASHVSSNGNEHVQCQLKAPHRSFCTGSSESALPFNAISVKQKNSNPVEGPCDAPKCSNALPFMPRDVTSLESNCIRCSSKTDKLFSQKDCLSKGSSFSVDDVSKKDLTEPLSLTMDSNLPEDSVLTNLSFAIPSPVSITTESPSVNTPSKGFPHVQMPDEESKSDLGKPGMELLLKTASVLPPTVENNQDDSTAKSSFLSLRTRAKSYISDGSLTPTKSPFKRSVTVDSSCAQRLPERTRSSSHIIRSGSVKSNLKQSLSMSSSLPNSPEKTYSTRHMVVEESDILGLRTRNSFHVRGSKSSVAGVGEDVLVPKSDSAVQKQLNSIDSPLKKVLHKDSTVMSPVRRSKRKKSLLSIDVGGALSKRMKVA